MASTDTGDKEIILKFFESSQQDFRQRVDLKQGVVIAYAGATAALIGFVIQQYSTRPSVAYFLLAIPMFSLLAACNFADHMLATTGIADYQIRELQPRFSKFQPVPPMLHGSSYLKPLNSIFWLLQLSELLLIGLPSTGSILAGVIILRQKWTATNTIPRYGLLCSILIDCVCSIVSLALLRKVAQNSKVFASRSEES